MAMPLIQALKNIAEKIGQRSPIQPYIQLLEEAFKKNTERELQEIDSCKKGLTIRRTMR